MRIKEIKVYKFAELSKEAKEKAINNHINFFLETTWYDNASYNFKKAVDKAEAMRTPWFVGSYVYNYCHDEIIESLEANDYEFNEKGEIE